MLFGIVLIFLTFMIFPSLQVYSYYLLIASCAVTLFILTIYDFFEEKISRCFGQKKADKEENKSLVNNDETANAHLSAESNV